MEPKLLYTANEVIAATGLSRTKVYALIANGEIPSIKIGASIRVPADKLREWIHAQLKETA